MRPSPPPASITSGPVALVGRRCADSYNLGLDYLHAALLEQGIPCTVLVLNGWQELDSVCNRILDAGTTLVGLSLADGSSSVLPLGLGELLQQKGFRGHVTCGGQFATLARAWLLERYAWLHSVVRFAGEGPLVQLACRLAAGRPLADVPGLTTRQGDGAPADVLDNTPMTITPRRPPDYAPSVLGHPVAHVAATRGCLGRCAYCGPAALACLERAEGRQRGVSRRALQVAGVGGVRRRPVDDVCDELASLWHDTGVRYFYFVDEHPLPCQERDALAYLDRLHEGLRRRDMTRWGLGTMLRSDQIVRRFARAGLVRALLGVEFATEEEGRLYGRRIHLDRIPALLEALADSGVATFSNLMLLHPHSTPDTISSGLDFIDTLDTGTIELNQMMVYHGTRLHSRLARQGRLLGNPLHYGYSYDDPILVRFARLFHRLRDEALSDYSLALQSYDAGLALALAARLHPGSPLADLRRAHAEVTAGIRSLYVATLRSALGLSRGDVSTASADELMALTVEGVNLLVSELSAISSAIPGQVTRPDSRFSPMREAAASAFKAVVLSTALAACSTDGVEPAADMPREVAVADATVDRPPPPDQLVCPGQQKEAVDKKVKATAPCFSGSVLLHQGAPAEVNPTLKVQNLKYCPNLENTKLLQAQLAKIRQALVSLYHPCLDGVGNWFSGDADKQFVDMNKSIAQTCAGGQMDSSEWTKLNGVQIVLGPDGIVAGVSAPPGSSPQPESVKCILKALQGLKFPCLAGHHLCVEHVILD